MSEKVHCTAHGETEQTFVCAHLLGESAGLGFNRDLPTSEKPFPDAWCDDCDIIYRAHNGWTEESEKLIKISLLCSGCYQRACIRNTHPPVTLDDLADLRWKCGSCEELHAGPCLDFGYSSPHYWSNKYAADRVAGTFLSKDYCAIENQYFFVRGVIEIPIVGASETFRWGVWGSLSKSNFETLVKMDEDPNRVELQPMFSWLSTKISEYPDTLNLKMHAHIQKLALRPQFELAASDHPLSQEYYKGISPERIKQIMLGRVQEHPQ